MFLSKTCPKCHKDAVVLNRFDGLQGIPDGLLNLECGHLIYERQLIGGKNPESFISSDHKRLMPFQVEGVRFIDRTRTTLRVTKLVPDPMTGVRALVTDEMGLGKTVQALGWLALQAPKTTGRVLFIVKSSLKVQWLREIVRWVDDEAMIQTIESSRDHWLMVQGYIIGFDLLGRIKDLPEKVKALGIKTLIVDECQQIKNEKAGRSIEVLKLSRVIPNVILLSGTPIKNNAGEYWAALNATRPDLFPSAVQYRMRECASTWSGYAWKAGGIYNAEEFKEKTSPFVIRRTREEVMPDLPKVFRRFQFDELGVEVEEAYKKAFLEFRDDYNSSEADPANTLALMSRMRHLTGISKVRPCVAHVEQFLEELPDKIMTIFFHHKDVGDLLEVKINKLLGAKRCLMLTSNLDSLQRIGVVDAFRNGVSPILLASTLSSAEGLNLQFCDEFAMLERQWNPANEEQAEGRFPRIGTRSTSISGTYFVAIGTIDEVLAEIVERKRSIVLATLDGKEVPWEESTIMEELKEKLASTGGRKWSL